jgi:PAS domain S-box-containing protein/putative nucleotidyltransferase with HDIG domain
LNELAYELDQPVNEVEVLRKSQQFNQLILDNAHDIIAIHKLTDLSYEYVNPATIKLLGYSQAELFTHSPQKLIHPDDLERVKKIIKVNLSRGEGQFEFRYRKKDGSYVWLESTLTIMPRETGEDAIIILSRDISDRKQAEAALQKNFDELEGKVQERTFQFKELTEQLQVKIAEQMRTDRALKAVSAVTIVMIQAENEQDLLKNVCQTVVEVGGYRLAWVGYVRAEQPQKVWPVTYAGTNNGFLAKVNINLQDPKRGKGPTGTAIQTRQPQVYRDFKKDVTFIPWLRDALRRGFKSGMAIPLIMDNRVLGTLSIYSGETDAFDKHEQDLLINMANNLAYAMISLRNRTDKNQTAQELKLSLEKMRRILMQSVTSLGTALNIRDPYTAGHQKKVALLAIAIAKEMGCSKDQIEGISVAGNLHDIGKIKVPSEILSKPGKLSELEFAHIKNHSQAGYEIVKDIEFPWPVAEVILQHHERMHGSGYPHGLIGEEILMEARIMAVADVVEAMASHHPYRPALGIDIALEEISQNKAILYDTDVVDACMKLFSEKAFKLQ